MNFYWIFIYVFPREEIRRENTPDDGDDETHKQPY